MQHTSSSAGKVKSIPSKTPQSRNLFDAQRDLRDYLTVPNVVGLIGAIALLLLLLVPPSPWNLRLPLYLAVMIWTILRPRVALYLLPICVPWGSLDYVDVGALRLNSADILVVFLVVGWLLQFFLPAYSGLRDREAGRIPWYLVLAMCALLGVMLLSMAVAINVKDSLKEISKWLEVLAILFLGSQYLRTRRQIWIIIALVLLAGISQAIFGYLQAFLNLGPQSFIRSAALRVYGTFDQPNPYAAYINLPLCIAISLALLGRDWLTRSLAAITAVMLGFAEFLSQSRGGELALAVAVIVMLLVGVPAVRVWARIVIVALLGAIGAALAGIIPASLFDPVLKFLGLTGISLSNPSPQDYSTAERLAHWIAGLRMYAAHPVLGVGIGNYPDAYASYQVTIFLDPLGHAHNYYINVAAEMGTIGLVVYLFFVAAIFIAGGCSIQGIQRAYTKARMTPAEPRQHVEAPLGTLKKLLLLLRPIDAVRYFRRQQSVELLRMSGNDRALAIGILAALVTVAAHNFVDDVYVHSLTNLIALLLIALIRLERVTPANKEQALSWRRS